MFRDENEVNFDFGLDSGFDFLGQDFPIEFTDEIDTSTKTTTTAVTPAPQPTTIPSNIIPTIQPPLVVIESNKSHKRTATEAGIPEKEKTKKKKPRKQKINSSNKQFSVVTQVSDNQEIIDVSDSQKVSVIKNTSRMIAITDVDYDPAEMEEVETRIANQRKARQQKKVRVMRGTGNITMNADKSEMITQEEAIVRRLRQHLHRTDTKDTLNFGFSLAQLHQNNLEKLNEFIPLYEAIITSKSFYEASQKLQYTTDDLFDKLKAYTPFTPKTLRTSRAIFFHMQGYSDNIKSMGFRLASLLFNPDLVPALSYTAFQNSLKDFKALFNNDRISSQEKTRQILDEWDNGVPLLQEYCQGKVTQTQFLGASYTQTVDPHSVTEIFALCLSHGFITLAESLWNPLLGRIIAQQAVPTQLAILKNITKCNRPDLKTQFIAAIGGIDKFDQAGEFKSVLQRLANIISLQCPAQSLERVRLELELDNIFKFDKVRRLFKGETIAFDTLNSNEPIKFFLNFEELVKYFGKACVNKWPIREDIWQMSSRIHDFYTGHPVKCKKGVYKISNHQLIQFFKYVLYNLSPKVAQDMWEQSNNSKLQYALMNLQNKNLLKEIFIGVISVCDHKSIQSFLFLLGRNDLDLVREVYLNLHTQSGSLHAERLNLLKNHIECLTPSLPVITATNNSNIQAVGVNRDTVVAAPANQASGHDQYHLAQNIRQTLHGASLPQLTAETVFSAEENNDPLIDLYDFFS